MQIGKFNWFYSIKNHGSFSLLSSLQKQKTYGLTEILTEATTKLRRCVICVGKQEYFGDVHFITVGLNGLYINNFYNFTQK
jgi:hypothetical protein